jgi:hypothetical protein
VKVTPAKKVKWELKAPRVNKVFRVRPANLVPRVQSEITAQEAQLAEWVRKEM